MHERVLQYFRRFIEDEAAMFVSTITVSEFCTGVKGFSDPDGDFDEIMPIDGYRIVPFNIDAAKLAAVYEKVLRQARRDGVYGQENRMFVAHDSMLFAQAELLGTRYFVTSDVKAKAKMDRIREACKLSVEHLDIHEDCNVVFGDLPFTD